ENWAHVDLIGKQGDRDTAAGREWPMRVPGFSSWRRDPLPGGSWIGPASGSTITGSSLHFAAHAYPSQVGAPTVSRVEFTASWPGRTGPWLVACRLTTPSHDDVYECDWPLSGVPSGDVNVSFDVYDQAGGVNQAPNGVRTVHVTSGGGGPG